ncbi:hypothetical protein F5146DRAFT_970396 [Armillaria mellea]|nr:hypothetical protein F5146DRAFT_970396 [Armillaria mellea]
MHPLFLSITLFSFFLSSHGEPRNVTIDDTDPTISYTGNWNASQPDSVAFNGSNAVSTDPLALATLIFTGTAVYFLSPGWAFPMNSTVTLDGEGATVVDLTAPAELSAGSHGGPVPERYTVYWSRTGLDNKSHKVVVSMASPGGWIIVDGFIFTVDDDTNNTASVESSTLLPAGSSSLVDQASSTSLFASATTAARSSGNDASDSIDGLVIGLGVSFSVLATLGCMAGCLLCRRRQLRRRNQTSPSSTSAPILYEGLPQANTSSHPAVPFFVANPDPGSEGSMIGRRYILEKSVQRRVVLEDVIAPPPAYSV